MMFGFRRQGEILKYRATAGGCHISTAKRHKHRQYMPASLCDTAASSIRSTGGDAALVLTNAGALQNELLTTY